MTTGSVTQVELNEILLNKLIEQSNHLISLQVLLYSLTDLIVEKGILEKEELEVMIQGKIKTADKLIKKEMKSKKTKKTNEEEEFGFMPYFGEPGEA